MANTDRPPSHMGQLATDSLDLTWPDALNRLKNARHQGKEVFERVTWRNQDDHAE